MPGDSPGGIDDPEETPSLRYIENSALRGASEAAGDSSPLARFAAKHHVPIRFIELIR